MSAQLDKSLDEILSMNKPKRVVKTKTKQNKVGKQLNVKKPIPNAPKIKSKIDTSFATKVIVYNMPKDIKQDAIKEFFQSQVGGVKSVALSYNEKGLSKGIATIIFNKSTSLSKAYEKFNGAPIDNGKSKLRLELIVDPTKKPLSARITANPIAAAVVTKKKQPTVKPKKEVKKAKKPVKKVKTVEDLDKEMDDYFESK